EFTVYEKGDDRIGVLLWACRQGQRQINAGMNCLVRCLPVQDARIRIPGRTPWKSHILNSREIESLLLYRSRKHCICEGRPLECPVQGAAVIHAPATVHQQT